MKQFVSIGFIPTALRFELNYRTDITAAIITLSHYTDKKEITGGYNLLILRTYTINSTRLVNQC